MSEHYTRAEDVPRLTTAWVEEFMGVDHRALAEYTAELRHKQHDAKCLIEELREEVDSLRAALEDARRAEPEPCAECARWDWAAPRSLFTPEAMA
ncbi:hypothetical protein SEA_HALLEY_203 [Mycobacterium phage Halley]|nr:hypothetical protein SEA_HALLEY_203 [Mycobacterium phage Halley]